MARVPSVIMFLPYVGGICLIALKSVDFMYTKQSIEKCLRVRVSLLECNNYTKHKRLATTVLIFVAARVTR
jgi:hypothetical protein